MASNRSRERVCPRSTIWHPNFDIAKHKEESAAAEQTRRQVKMARLAAEQAERVRLAKLGYAVPPAPTSIRKAFDGVPLAPTLSSHYCMSTILGLPTIFTPEWPRQGEIIAEWPDEQEMKYEGIDRITIVALHRRFLPLPRHPPPFGEDPGWQHRFPKEPYPSPLDNFFFPTTDEDEIFFRNHWIGELEVDDWTGEEVLGPELVSRLHAQTY